MKIVGIDPGLAVIGVGVIEAHKGQSLSNPDWLTITTPSKMAMAERLHELQCDLDDLLEDEQPDLAVVEKIFFAVNEKTAIDVAHARGVILATLADHGIPVIEATPLQLKSCITGDGKADKRQVQDMLVRMLRLKEVPSPVDASDALALAVYGAMTGALKSALLG